MSVTVYNKEGGIIPLSSFQDQGNPLVKVVNTHKLDSQLLPGYTLVKIGRPSVLGNPFKLGEPYQDEREGVYQRGEAVIDHEKWFRAQMSDPDSNIKAEVLRLAERVARGEKLALCCYCYPLACHGTVIAKAIIAYARKMENPD